MRARPLLAALTAATLALGGAVATALPANAAECDGPCAASIDITGPTKIGIGGAWNEFTVEVTNETDEPLDLAALPLLLGPGDAVDAYDVWVDQADGSGWDELEPDWVGGEWVFDLTPTSDELLPDVPHVVDLRVAATHDLLTRTLGQALAGLDPETDDVVGALDGVTDISLDLELEVSALGTSDDPEDIPVLGVATAPLNVSTLDIVIDPADLAIEVGQPSTVTASLVNRSESHYAGALLLPIVPGSDGGLGGEISPTALQPLQDLGAATSVKAGLRALRTLTEESRTLVEYRLNGEWITLEQLLTDFGPDDAFRAIAPGGTSSRQWRFTFQDEAVLETPVTPTASPSDEPSDEPYDPTYYGDDIIWIAVNLNLLQADGYDGLPPFQLLGLDSTPVSIAEPVVPTPTPTASVTATPTTAPVVDADPTDTDTTPTNEDGTDGDEAPGTDDGSGEGTGAGGELATTGQNLSSQAMAALLLLVVGALAVVATLQRRRAGAGQQA